jgi:hypothetical protein
LNPFIDDDLLGGNRFLLLFLLLGSVFHYGLLFICLLYDLFLLLGFRFRLAFFLWDWNLLFTLSEKIDGKGGRECGMLRDETLNALFFEVLDGVLLQNERNFGTPLEGVTARIRVDFKGWLIGVAREDMLDRLGVLGGGGRERRDIDLIRDQERAVKTKTKCTNEVPVSALVAFGWKEQVSGFILQHIVRATYL